MNSLALLTRPIWNCPRREGYWRKFRCSYTCTGHIVPFNRLHEINIVEYPIDIEEWRKAMGQEFRAYKALINPSTKEGGAKEVEESSPVQEIDQAQPKEVSNESNPPPKEKKLYTPKPKPEQKTGGSSGRGFGPRH